MKPNARSGYWTDLGRRLTIHALRASASSCSKSTLDEVPQLWKCAAGRHGLRGTAAGAPEFVEWLTKEILTTPYATWSVPASPAWAQVRYRYGNTVDDAKGEACSTICSTTTYPLGPRFFLVMFQTSRPAVWTGRARNGLLVLRRSSFSTRYLGYPGFGSGCAADGRTRQDRSGAR